MLRTAGIELPPDAWDAPTGGHHRQGALRFPATSTNGTAVIAHAASAPRPNAARDTLQLVIRDVAGVPERTFQWQH